MHVPNRSLQILVAVGISALITGFIPITHAQNLNVPSQVNIIASTCGLMTPLAMLDYGSLLRDEESSEKPLDFSNNGNVEGDVSIQGLEWASASSAGPVMSEGATHWSVSSGNPYAASNPLTQTSAFVISSTPGEANAVYMQLKATLNNPAFSGTATQSVSLSISC